MGMAMPQSQYSTIPHYSIPIHDHLITVKNAHALSKLADNIVYFGNTERSIQGMYESREFNRFIHRIRRHGKPVSIMFGKTDSAWMPHHEDQLPSNVIRVFANNVTFSSERSRPFPMGRDFRLAKSAYLDKKFDAPLMKDIACYANFSSNTHHSRSDLESACHLNPSIHTEHLGSKFLHYKVSYEDFLAHMSRSKFCLCPRGNGFDSFRFWDSLYMGAIPIITDDSLIKNMNINVPYVVMSPEEIKTANFGELTYEWSPDYEEHLRLSYWLGRVATEGHEENVIAVQFRNRQEWHSVELDRRSRMAKLASQIMSLLSKAKRTLMGILRF